jgi:hypothetical protein
LVRGLGAHLPSYLDNPLLELLDVSKEAIPK